MVGVGRWALGSVTYLNHARHFLKPSMSTEILRRDIIDVIDIRPFSQVKK
jgi:hypothetical protein